MHESWKRIKVRVEGTGLQDAVSLNDRYLRGDRSDVLGSEGFSQLGAVCIIYSNRKDSRMLFFVILFRLLRRVVVRTPENAGLLRRDIM